MLGSGFSMQFFKDAQGVSRVAAFWYTYGPEGWGAGPGDATIRDQRWYSCEGRLNEDTGLYEMTIYEVTDARWMRLMEPTFNAVGTATLELNGLDQMRFSYEIDADGVEGTGAYDLVRAF